MLRFGPGVGVEVEVTVGNGIETGAWAGFEAGGLWGTGFVNVDALFGVDERAGWMGAEGGVAEMEHAEPEAGFGAGQGRG